tara:strand:- start:232 stop:804 length:573 start_codon:yes stop_codon:yes gene_type:complete
MTSTVQNGNDHKGTDTEDHSKWCLSNGYTKSATTSQGGGSRRRRRGGGTKKGMRRKTGRLAYSKRRGKGGGTKKGMRRKTGRLAYSKRHGKGGMARVGSRGKGKWRCVVNGRRCTRVRRGGGTKKGMRRKTGRLAYSKRRGKGGTKKGMRRKTARLAYSKRHGKGGKRRRCPKYCRRKTLRCKTYGRRRY